MEDIKVQLIELCKRRQFTVSAGGAATIIIGRPVRIGPFIKSITVHALIEDMAASSVSLTAEYSYDGETWTSFAASLATFAAQGSSISSPYTTATDFGMYIRFKVNVAGTVGNPVTVSLTLACEFLS